MYLNAVASWCVFVVRHLGRGDPPFTPHTPEATHQYWGVCNADGECTSLHTHTFFLSLRT